MKRSTFENPLPQERLTHAAAGYGVAVMINSNHPAFMDELIRAVAQEYGWAGYKIYRHRELPEAAIQRYRGRYRYNDEQAFTVYADGGRMFMQYVGGSPEELLYIGNDRYMRRERTAPIAFTEDNEQIRFHFVMNDGGYQTHDRLEDGERLPREMLFSVPYAEALAAYRAIKKAKPATSRCPRGTSTIKG